MGQGVEINRDFSNGLKDSTFIVIKNSPFTQLGEEYTFVIWAKMYSREQQDHRNCSENLIKDKPKACILSLGGWRGINFFIYLDNYWESNFAFSGEGRIGINEWQQMIMTNDKNGFRIYNNGNSIKDPDHHYYPDFSLVNESDIILGKRPSHSNGCFDGIPLNGMIDDFRLYNTSITDEEALGLYSLSVLQTGVDCLSDLKRTNLNIFSRSEFSNNAEQYFIDIFVETDCRYPLSLYLYSFSNNQQGRIPIKMIDNGLSKNFSLHFDEAQISKLKCEIDLEVEILFIKIIRNCSLIFELISNNYTALKYPFYFLIEKNLSQTIESKVLLVPTSEVPPVKPELEKYPYLSIFSFCQDCNNAALQKGYFNRNGYIFFEIWKKSNPHKLSDPIEDAILILIQATVSNQADYGNKRTFDVLNDINIISSSYQWKYKYSLFLENILYGINGNCDLSLTFLFLNKNQTIGSEILKVSFDVYDDKENTNSEALLILLIVCIILSVAVLSLLAIIIKFVILKR